MRVRFGPLSDAEQRRLRDVEERAARFIESGSTGQVSEDLWLESVPGAGCVLRTGQANQLPLMEHLVAKHTGTTRPVSVAPALPFELALSHALPAGEFAQASVRVGFSRGHLLDVVFGLPGGTGSERELEAAERLMHELLGGRRALAWLGRVSVVPAPRPGPLKMLSPAAPVGTLTLADVVPTFEAAIRGLYAGFPEVPRCKLPTLEDWSLFELEPEPAAEYSAQDDLVFASSCVPEALKCYLSGLPFASERFSRCGERFFYVKYASSGSPEERLRIRQRFEDQLDRTLMSCGVGRVVGAGLGLSYSYVHCALHGLERGLALMAEAAQRCELPTESWLLPFDSEFADEWLGVWPRSAPPPGADTPGADTPGADTPGAEV